MTIKELQKWLLKMEKEGAVKLEVEMDCFHGTVKLFAKEPSETLDGIPMPELWICNSNQRRSK